MKCPCCGYVSFDDLAACKKCGRALPGNRIGAGVPEQNPGPADGPGGAGMQRPEGLARSLMSIKKDLEEIDTIPAEATAVADDARRKPAGAGGAEQNGSGSPGTRTVIRDRAGFFVRLAACAIDNIVLGIVGCMLLAACYLLRRLLAGDGAWSDASLLVAYALTNWVVEACYFIYFHAVTGQTVGKAVCGIRVIAVQGTTLGLKRSLLRYFGRVVSRMSLYLGFVWVLFDSKKQGWHDKIAGSFVVRERRSS